MRWVSRVDSRLSIIDCAAGEGGLGAALLRADQRVEYVVPDQRTGHPASVPNDTEYVNQFASYPAFKNCLESAWSVQTNSDVIIAVVDSGVALQASDFYKNLWRNNEVNNGIDDDGNGIIDDIFGCEYVDPADGPTSPPGEPHSVPLDTFSHGTEVFSMIAAEGDNSSGSAGTVWHGTVMSAKCYAASGGGSVIWLSDAVSAIDYAVAEGAKILNCSWYFHGYFNDLLPLYEVIKASPDRLFVVAAGNDDLDLDHTSGPLLDFFPQEYTLSNILVVGSSNGSDSKSSFSNWGADSVDIFAPGENLRLLATNSSGTLFYVYDNGTSFAAPLVAGVCAMVWQNNPSFSPEDVIQEVLDNSDTVHALSGLCNGSSPNDCVRLDPYRVLTHVDCP